MELVLQPDAVRLDVGAEQSERAAFWPDAVAREVTGVPGEEAGSEG